MLSPSSLRRAALAGWTMDGRPRPSRLPGSAVLLLTVVALAAGCSAKAKTANAPAVPPLTIPAPPPRELPTVEEIATIASNPPEVPISETSSSAAPKPAQPGRTAAQQQPKVEPPAVVATPLPPEATLRPISPEDQEKERQIELMVKNTTELLDNMKAGLNRFSQGNRVQYEDARRFLQDAQKALREKRFSYAQVNAEKAQTIAKELSK